MDRLATLAAAAGGCWLLRALRPGYASRGKLPEVLTTLNDAAIPANNEAPTGPPPLPANPGP